MAVELNWSKCNVGEITRHDDALLGLIACFARRNGMTHLTAASVNEWLYRECMLNAAVAANDGLDDEYLMGLLETNRDLLEEAVAKFDGLEVTYGTQKSRDEFMRGIAEDFREQAQYGEPCDMEAFTHAACLVDEFVAEAARRPFVTSAD